MPTSQSFRSVSNKWETSPDQPAAFGIAGVRRKSVGRQFIARESTGSSAARTKPTSADIACHLAGPALVDGGVNGGETTEVIELSEQTISEQKISEQRILDEVIARLTDRYPTISETTVSAVVHDAYSRFDGRPLRDFVPLLVERNANSELQRLGATAV